MADNILDQSAHLEIFGVSLHRAIVNNLIGEIKTAIADGRIRSADGRHSVYDFIREILGKKTERQVWKRFVVDFPAIVTFCDDSNFPRLDGRMGKGKKTPTSDLNGLVYIGYFANCDFSHQLRASSAAYFAADRQQQPPARITENTIAQLEKALDSFPNTLDKVWKTSGIVNKSQVKKAIVRDFVEERDYVWASDKLCVNDSTFAILIVSFRSWAGTNVEDLPEIIHIKTREYFQHQANKKMNRRIAQDSEWEQLNLFS
ncbi:MAG: hypothetical protein ACMG55_18180 [Microcoleus sp.]